MLFNSYEFIFLFLPVVFFGFFWVAQNSHRLAALWLAAASLFFYGWWNPQFVLLLLASIGCNYALGYAIGHVRIAKTSLARGSRILAAAIIGNLLLLGYYKYTNFFVGTVNTLAGTSWGSVDIILPLGISFFTFTQIAFLVDVHRGIAREYSFIHYLLFVSYFPHLIAGPVLHHKQMMPQFGHAGTYKLNTGNVSIGLTIFAIGLFKKVILADQFALYANPVFDAAAGGGEPKLVEAWIGAVAYTLQLYFDFSGYSDMAIGASRIFNVKLPLNFNSPYKAINIIEFWRRWHMTLSAFLRDYLYIPLGGNRFGITRRYANLMTTMLLGGLWHGANWTFVLWGGLHGIYLVINHGWQALCSRLALRGFPGGVMVSGALTFAAVVLAWVPFRAASFAAAMRMLSGMAGLSGVSLPDSFESQFSSLAAYGVSFTGIAPVTGLDALGITAWLTLGLAIVWTLPNTQQWLLSDELKDRGSWSVCPKWAMWRPSRGIALLTGASLAISILGVTRTSQFLYFQF